MEDKRGRKRKDFGIFGMDERRADKTGSRDKLISVAVMVLLFVTAWHMLTPVLLTFVITFLFFHLFKFVRLCTDLTFRGRFAVPDGLILSFIYVVFIAILMALSIVFAPKLVVQITAIARILMNFNVRQLADSLSPVMFDMISNLNISPYVESAGTMILSWLRWFGGFSINLLLALLLSYLLLLERKKIQKFGDVLEKSRVSFLYRCVMNFGVNFARTFAKVMKVQLTIAFINCILSAVLLSILDFPQVMGLAAMIFVLGLIPVAGVIISLFPLVVVAFNIGGLSKVVAVVVMVVVLHALEAYVLNPRLMADRTALPMCLVAVILIVAEHYLNIWGLLIGVPLFIFLLDRFEVDYASAFEGHASFLSVLRRRTRRASAPPDDAAVDPGTRAATGEPDIASEAAGDGRADETVG